MYHFRTLMIVCIGLLSSASAAFGEEALTEYTQTSAKLIEHLRESIPVLELSSGSAKNEQDALTNRLESLQNKKVSNREWHEYWQEHVQISDTLIASLTQLTPDTLEKRKRVLTERLKALQIQSQTPALIVKERINTLKNEIRNLNQLNGQLDARLDTINQTLKKLGATAAQLAPPSTPNTTSPKGDKLAQAIRDTEAKIEQLTQTYQRNEADLLVKESRLETLTVDPKSLSSKDLADDPELAEAISRIRALSEEQSAGAGIQQEIETLNSSLQKLELLRGTSLKEKLFLTKWRKLAADKMKSQDVYLKAIDEELAAVEQRLRTFVSQTKEDEEKDGADDPCQPTLTNAKTPFFNHRRCIATLKRKLDESTKVLKQTQLEGSLYTRFATTNAQLIAAQSKDVELVRRERKLSAEAMILNTRSELWTSVWSAYHKRGESKESNLEEALQQTKKNKRVIKAKLAVFSVAAERHKTRIAGIATRLDERSSTKALLKAVGLTIWSIVRVGWPALVYLLIAITLIRFVRSVRDKKERESEQIDSGQTHENLQRLENELRLAQEAEDEELVMSLHEEIGVVESQLKDQGQRVATIARVAAQAISLVIYIATTLLVLDALTVDIGPILGGAAIFGLAISFGSQSLVKDVVSGFFILLENQYAVGDVVNINGKSGGVEKITLRRTVLRNSKGEVHNLTNGSITSVTNMTQGWARVVMHLGVAYGTDIDFVKSVVNTVGEHMYQEEEWRSKLTEKPSFVGVTAFGESEITIRVWCKTKTFQNWSVERELNIRLKTAFEEAGIEIPFPKRDINLVITKPELDKTLGAS